MQMKNKMKRFFALVTASLTMGIQAPLTDVNQVVREAFSHRQIVVSARFRVLASEKERDSMSAWPATKLEAGNGTRPDVSGGEDLTLTQPIDLFGKSRAARAQGQAEVRRAKASYRQTLLDVQGETIRALLELKSAESLVKSTEEQLAIAKKLNESTVIRVQARTLPEIQITRAGLEVKRVLQSLADRQAALQSAKKRLFSACGADIEPPSSADLSSSLLIETDLKITRPDLLTIQADIDLANAEARQSKLSLFPDFEIQARRSPWSGDEQQYGARFQFSFPLWDNFSSRFKESAATARKRSAMAQMSDSLFGAQKEVEAAEIDLANAESAVKSYQSLKVDVLDLLSKTQRGFELGASTLVDVLDAKRALTEAQEAVIEAELRRGLALESLLRAKGIVLGEPK